MTERTEDHEVRDGDRVLRFTGELLAFESSERPGKPRWMEVRVYRTASGSYVTSVVGRTTLPRERDRHRAQVSETPEGVVESLYQYDDEGVRYLTHLAKRALEAAGRRDAALEEAYRVERVA